jgi:ribosome recycling factor
VKNKQGLAKDLIFKTENSIDTLSHQFMATAEQMLETKQKELLGNSD